MIGGGEVVHKSVAIEIGPAIDVDSILGIQPPDEIPTPVLMVQDRSGRVLCSNE